MVVPSVGSLNSRYGDAPRFGHTSILIPSITLSELCKTWCHWINPCKLYSSCVGRASTLANHRHGTRHPFTSRSAWQRGGVGVSRLHRSIGPHKVADRRGEDSNVASHLQVTAPEAQRSARPGCARLLLKKGFLFDCGVQTRVRLAVEPHPPPSPGSARFRH